MLKFQKLKKVYLLFQFIFLNLVNNRIEYENVSGNEKIQSNSPVKLTINEKIPIDEFMKNKTNNILGVNLISEKKSSN